ncbi:hypothetical protein HVIM_03998 [Roseomonas mucosa]|uniref:Uncharacterized protein n=1 Tax=Roseomonas mucosa TaxID=207340 RepID=A0A4Y1MUY0_9PROT|nr:hypothetical protein RADP37_03998 [Roseomonas mucosa]QDD93438.1 hypothetical protein HVIM_03998 [Roseomonas mucosa]QDD98541.1 hypothetical protein ADP8_03998 [Roseomonas mucosa]UZO90734.1 Hypothetical protein RMP42_03998 [Roseomonas mucosa]
MPWSGEWALAEAGRAGELCSTAAVGAIGAETVPLILFSEAPLAHPFRGIGTGTILATGTSERRGPGTYDVPGGGGSGGRRSLPRR